MVRIGVRGWGCVIMDRAGVRVWVKGYAVMDRFQG